LFSVPWWSFAFDQTVGTKPLAAAADVVRHMMNFFGQLHVLFYDGRIAV